MKSLLLLFALCAPLLAIYSPYPECTGTINEWPLIDSPPQLVDSVVNGKRYNIQSELNNTHVDILVLRGSWSEIGTAYGTLMKDDLNDALMGMFDYIVSQYDDWIQLVKANLPFWLKWIPDLLTLTHEQQLAAILDIQYAVTIKFTPARYEQEMEAIAKASGMDVKWIKRLNMFPEFIKASCSMAGIWGPASSTGKLLQLRALDWDSRSYIGKFPIAVIYFPDEEGSNPFATFGFTGLVGAISGYSTKVGVSEKVWNPQVTDAASYFGEPFTYILRDILQFGNDLKSSVGIISSTPRTCRVHVGVGSRADNAFLGMRMGWNALEIYDDKNYTDYTEVHPQMDGIMFWDKHGDDKNACLGQYFRDNYGKIDPEFLYKIATPTDQTGNAQLIVYDFAADLVYLSYSDPDTNTNAYDRPRVKLDMAELLNYNSHF